MVKDRYFRFQTRVCQNVSNERKFVSLYQISGDSKIPPSLPLSKDEVLRSIGHSIRIGNLILGVNDVTFSYLIYCDSLLQNATDIMIIYGSYFITKCDRTLLQNVTVITKYGDCYKLRQYADRNCSMFSR